MTGGATGSPCSTCVAMAPPKYASCNSPPSSAVRGTTKSTVMTSCTPPSAANIDGVKPQRAAFSSTPSTPESFATPLPPVRSASNTVSPRPRR